MKWKNAVSVFFFSLCGLLLVACSSSKFSNDLDDVKYSAESPEVQRRSAIRMQLAVEYFQAAQYRLALDEVRQVITLTPNQADAYGLRALIQMELNDPARAEENFLLAMKMAPTNTEIVNNYAWFLCQTGREKQSLAYFERVLRDRLYPTPVKAMVSAGVCNLRLKNVAEAERYFTMGLEIEPNNPSVNVNLAKIYYDKGQFERARPYIQRILKDEIFAADVLWLAIKIENKLGDQAAVVSLGTQLRRRHPASKEYTLFQKGAFNE